MLDQPTHKYNKQYNVHMVRLVIKQYIINNKIFQLQNIPASNIEINNNKNT